MGLFINMGCRSGFQNYYQWLNKLTHPQWVAVENEDTARRPRWDLKGKNENTNFRIDP